MNQSSPIIWRTETRKLGELQDYVDNPRKMGKDEFQKLVESLQQDGYHGRIKIDTHNVIIGGHSRKKAMLKAGYTLNDEIEVLTPTIPLSEEEFDRINIRDNLPYGSFDFDILGNNFEPQQLIDWGMPPSMLGQSHYDIDSANEEIEQKVK